METLTYQILFVLLYTVLAGVLLSTIIGVPGNWILVGVALIVALITGFERMTWVYLLICVGLATVGEIIESLLGALVVAGRGGSRWGVLGSMIGGFLGVILAAGVYPPLGSVIFGFLGAFAGAVAGEYYKHRETEHALRIGFWSFVGRAGAIAGKLGVGCAIFWILITTTWP